MVVTAKVKKRNLLIVLAAIAAILAMLLWPSGEEKKTANTVTEKVETNDDRVAFLRQFGWDVNEAPLETQEVRIPEEPNEVFSRYNELQQSQGYDMDNFAGKVVKRYVYDIKNHPDASGSYRATIFIYRGKVIGGDVASTDAGGQMHGFAIPQ